MTENITFRYLTPIFSHNRSANFEHSGQYKDASYNISLKGYDIPLEDMLRELLEHGNETAVENLQDINCSERFSPSSTNVFLVIDVVQPLTEERRISTNSQESLDIFEKIITSLRLHIKYGLLYEYTYIFNFFPSSGERHNYSRFCSSTLPIAIFKLLGNNNSFLLTEDENSCKITFQNLLDKQWDETKTPDKLLQLALEYHRLSFTLERVDHAFLILMVVFEALFKKEGERNANNAADRIAKLLATVQSESSLIKDVFYDHPQTAFSKIRNAIAHGDSNLDRTTVENQYPELYKYITKAIIKLINIPNGKIGTNYYDDLEKYIDEEFSKLKQS